MKKKHTKKVHIVKKQKKEKHVKKHLKKEKKEKKEQHLVHKIPVLNSVLSEAPARISKPKINLQTCQNNYNCIIFCPHNAISKNDKGRPVIDYNLCTGCLICLRECPTGAIFEERE
ncbi:MAG: 4Fe-4S binding protein [Candidatus Aenigmarchaeota archaeon]|nr:4Fe-4S binding protein [Candidatus Aenigmarchaeota archaeon]